MTPRKTFLLLVLPFLLACGLMSFRTDASDERPVSTVFDNPVCELPCWNYVVPGSTTYEQAHQILKEIATFEDDISESPMGLQETVKTITYRRYNSQLNKYTERVEIIFTISGLVDTIYFSSAGAKITVPYVISRLGEPDSAVQGHWGPRPGLLIMHYPYRGIQVNCLPDCNAESDVYVILYPPDDYKERLIREYGSPEKAEYAKKFFCPWVGVEASYLSVNWGPFNFPDEYPEISPAEIKSRCPTGE